MELKIRPAQPSDAACLAALSIQVWLTTYATDGIRASLADYVLDEFTPARFAALLANPARCLLVAERNGHLLGYALLTRDSAWAEHDGPTLELERLYVMASHHGLGVGKTLLQAARQWAGAQPGSPRLWLTTWHRNERAIAFYRRMGLEVRGEDYFELEGERHLNYVLVDAAPIDERLMQS